MPKRKTPPPIPGPLQISPQQGTELIERQIHKANQLLDSGHISGKDFESWQLLTQNYLVKAFGENSPNVSSVMDSGKIWAIPPSNVGPDWWQREYISCLKSQVGMLEALGELLQTEVQLSEWQAPDVSQTG